MGNTSRLRIFDSRRLHDFFDTCPIGVLVEDIEGQPIFVNPAFCSMLGFSEEEICGKHCIQFSPPDDAAKDWALFQQLRAGSIDRYQLEKRYFRRDGSLVWAHLSLSLLSWDGSPLVLAIVQEITAQKTAEQALRRSEERLRLAQKVGHIGTFERDVTSGVTTWTSEMESMYGLRPGGFGQTKTAFENLIHPEDRHRVVELVDWALKTGQPTIGEWRTVWPDQSVHWIAGRWQVFMNERNEPERVVGANIDITERKLAEDKLREYERAVEGAEEMIAVVDREYRFLIANRQFLKQRSMTKEQVVGHFAYEVLNKGVFDGIVKPRLDECFRGNVVRYELKYSYPGLGERDVSAAYFPIEGATGIDRAACIVQDITDRKRAEESLAGVARKLIEAQEQERTRIGRELHDDINQRLAMLKIDLECLENDPAAVSNRLQDLQQQVLEISNDVQALSHDLHSSKLQYLGIVAGMKSWCKEFGQRQKAEIEFTSEVSDSLSFEIGLCLFRVLQEALHNAIKHSGVRRFGVVMQQYGNEVHLTVSDTGRGFDIGEAMKTTGLGLTSMHERVRLVNGTIAIKSELMRGTTINVRIPLTSTQGRPQVAS